MTISLDFVGFKWPLHLVLQLSEFVFHQFPKTKENTAFNAVGGTYDNLYLSPNNTSTFKAGTIQKLCL